jgi:hypothetical protein
MDLLVTMNVYHSTVPELQTTNIPESCLLEYLNCDDFRIVKTIKKEIFPRSPKMMFWEY